MVLRFSLLAAVLVAWSPTTARATTCGPPPAATVLYPGSGGVGVPRDAVILARVRSGFRLRFKLIARNSGREVWLQIKRQPGLWRLAPSRLLAANTFYELRMVGLRRKVAPVLTTFQTGGKIFQGGKPSFRRAQIRFTAHGKQNMIRSAGRQASVQLEADPAPRVVEVRVSYKKGRRWSATWRSAHVFQSTLQVASTGVCQYLRRPAPARGRYKLTLVPWGPTGHKGPELKLTGVIR